MSQYFLKLPLEFPIAWQYSIITYGRVSEVSLARCSTRAGLSYISERMSLTVGRSSPSYWTTRVVSYDLIQSRMLTKVLPPPASLPRDQITTEAWFLSRWTMFWARATQAALQSGWSPGYSSRMPWVSRLVSSTR